MAALQVCVLETEQDGQDSLSRSIAEPGMHREAFPELENKDVNFRTHLLPFYILARNVISVESTVVQ